MEIKFGNDWDEVLAVETKKPYFSRVLSFLSDEYERYTVYPPRNSIFSSLEYVSYAGAKVVIVGQDPYINDGQANGLAFAVGKGVALPPSLKNIYNEIESDIGCSMKGKSGELTGWAEQGVLLLNATLTVRAGSSNAHQSCGWQEFTDFIIGALAERRQPLVFILWGANARKKAAMIPARHLVLQSAHPSPMSASSGFFGSKPFSKTNKFLIDHGFAPIDWSEAVRAKLPYYYNDFGKIIQV